MNRFASILLLLAICLALKTGKLSAADEKLEEDKSQVLFYLDDERLITLKFLVTVDGKPFGETWQKFLDEQFDNLDKDQDGKLTTQELNLLANQRVLTVLRAGQRVQNEKAYASFESLSREQFADYVEHIGFQPFEVTIQSPPNQQQIVSFSGMPSDPNQAAKLLFGHLDQDGDGRLSREEQENALKSLSKLDLDQDETISTAELVPVNMNRYIANASGGRAQQNQTAFLSLGEQSSLREVASKLTAKYDKNQTDKALSQQEVGIPQSLFARHDRDENGQWDFDEMQQFLRNPAADVTIVVRLGKGTKAKERIEFQHEADLSAKVKNAIGSLNFGSVQMEISATPTRWHMNLESMVKAQFQPADIDNNGYVDKDEANRLGNLRSLFDILDQDHDKKLFLDEAVEGMLPVARFLTQQVRLSVTDRGRDLFRILDGDGDNRLSQREFWAMPDRAALWDKDNNGQIAQEDIPQQYRLMVREADLSGLNGNNGLVVASPAGGSSPRNTPTTSGPLWFQRMDRNGDADVSKREFLGTPESFQKLDQDGDGLISPDEAAAASKE